MATSSYGVRRWRQLVLGVAAPALFCACQDCCRGGGVAPPAPPAADANARPVAAALAHLEQQRGSVTVTPKGGKEAPAAAEQLLYADDVVKTGSDGEVDVVFAGNNRIHLGPNAALLVHDTGAVSSQVGAVVLQGSVRASSGGSGVTLNIGTPIGMAKLGGDKVAVLEVDMGKGLSVTAGEVVLARPDRLDVLPLTLNQTLKLDALPVLLPEQQMVDEPAAAVANLAPQPPPSLPARLTAATGAPMRQLGGHGAYRAMQVGDALTEGDKMRLGSDDTADVHLGEDLDVQLRGGELAFAGTTQAEQGLRARYQLRGGQARLRIASNKGHAGHEAEVAGAVVQVAPGAKEAKVDVDASGKGSDKDAHVVVRYGQVHVGATEVEAGQAVAIRDGRASAPYPAFPAPVALRNGREAVLYVGKEVPPVRFGTERRGGGAHHVELAEGADFAQVAAAENTKAGPFVSDEVSKGTIYWRDRRGAAADAAGTSDSPGAAADAAPTKLVVARETMHHCRDCQGEATLDDDGQPSVVMYPHVPPDTTLRWGAVEEATGYRVLLRRADAEPEPKTQPDAQKASAATSQGVARGGQAVAATTQQAAPSTTTAGADASAKSVIVDEVVRGTTYLLPSRRLREGSYRWSVTPVDGEGKALADGKDNGLRLDFDNGVHGLEIATPGDNRRTRRLAILTQGAVEPGATLQINGQQVPLTNSGQFRSTLPLRPGLNRLVYRVSAPNAPERIWVRTVTAQPPASGRKKR